MRIAQVCDFYLPRRGGLELHLVDLTAELRRAGHEVEVITSTPGEGEVRLPLALVPGLGVSLSPRILSLLRRHFQARSFDLVHWHTAYSPLGAAAGWISTRLGLPCVMTEHSVSRGLGAIGLRAAHLALGWGRWPRVLTGVSRYVATELAQITGRQDVEVLPACVRPEEWHPAELQAPVVVSMMRFTARKRPLDVVEVARRVIARRPDARFVLYGDGPLRPRVEAAIRRYALHDRFELGGFVDRETLARALAGASVFLLPTQKEALSVSCLQARAAGLPVVAISGCGVEDAVRHGRDGFLCADLGEQTERVVALLDSIDLRRSLGGASRAALPAEFGWTTGIMQHLDLYRRASR